MKVWASWATLGWAVLAFLVGWFGTLLLLSRWRPDILPALVATSYDGDLVTAFLLVSNPITVAVIVLAVRLRGVSVADYLGLVAPTRRQLALGIGCLVVLIAISDALLYLSGQALVTPFQMETYASTGSNGWLAAMLIGVIIVAPAGEEIMFRGFMFRGWVASSRSAWPPIIVISMLWAGLHGQYDWVGMLQIFVIGLFLGYMRWWSGSTLLTFVLHALSNLEATVETALRIHFLS